MGAPRRAPIRPIAREIGEQTELGEVYLTALVRAQLRLAVTICTITAVVLGGLPVLFAVVPSTSRVHVVGIPLPWILLGLLVYPVMIGLGWRAVVLAERNESDFAELVQRG
jgi:hypothetical protein